MMLTDPAQAKDFVARTAVDALAIAIGTSHGAYKFTRQPSGDILDIDRIAKIHKAVPNTHLVMHGSSSVPQEWLAIIREHGGDIKETYGVPVEEIQRGIRSGVRKVNIDTDIRLAMTGAMRQSFDKDPSEFDPRKSLIAAEEGRARRGQGAVRGLRVRRAGRPHSADPARRDGQALQLKRRLLRAILWDVDGTLAETERDGHLVAFNQAFEALNVPWRWSEERYGELLAVTGGRERLLHDMQCQDRAPADPQERRSLVERVHRLKNELYAAIVASGELPLREGVRELLVDCDARGFGWAS